MSRFKNSLCLASLPDGYRYAAYTCRRHANHPGKHQVVFRDGFKRVWADGDKESRREKR